MFNLVPGDMGPDRNEETVTLFTFAQVCQDVPQNVCTDVVKNVCGTKQVKTTNKNDGGGGIKGQM